MSCWRHETADKTHTSGAAAGAAGCEEGAADAVGPPKYPVSGSELPAAGKRAAEDGFLHRDAARAADGLDEGTLQVAQQQHSDSFVFQR